MSPLIQFYRPKNKIRVVTAASLFDGHDVSINMMRRLLQAAGVEVIHLGHNRSVLEIVNSAIQEDVQAVAITSYQGGHNEFFKYMVDLFKKKGAGHIQIFAGGGGTILPNETESLHQYGITRIYSPDDGRTMGLQGMVNDLIAKADVPTKPHLRSRELSLIQKKDAATLARVITCFENHLDKNGDLRARLQKNISSKPIPVVGITGTGGSGKSSLTDELLRLFLNDFRDKHVAVLAVDPSKRKTGGALLGDRIRMNTVHLSSRVWMRSFATRQVHLALSKTIQPAVDLLKVAGYDLILVETAGIGQGDSEITEIADLSLYVMTPEYGASSQLEKIDMIDFADLIAINKFDQRGGMDALRDVRKQFQRSHQLWNEPLEKMSVYGTIASRFNENGVIALYHALIDQIVRKTGVSWKSSIEIMPNVQKSKDIIPPERVRYLAEIVEKNREYKVYTQKQSLIASQLYQLHGVVDALQAQGKDTPEVKRLYSELQLQLDRENKNILEVWEEKKKKYQEEDFTYLVRNKEIKIKNFVESLSHLKIPKIALPKFHDWGDILDWTLNENVPGEFPYAAGVYPFKRTEEDPLRMFAGEGSPERTNQRFHYLNEGMSATRLSTAFDSVTLYGEDPNDRPDIYGKVGNSGVNIATLDDMKKLYSGFDLCDPATSVSMTINGPAPMLLGFFMNAAIDQQCEKYIHKHRLKNAIDKKIHALFKKKNIKRPVYDGLLPSGNNGFGLMLLGMTGDQVLPHEIYEKIKTETLTKVRGTVQADILKEDQAQNTCIFSIEFALRMMGDIQQYFIDHHIQNFYSVSISGYHIAEAGANPITQLALTLSNGFTYVEYYLSRGMKIDEFAPNLSFFFSNGMDAEYSVIGRVARRIWAKAIKHKYGGNSRSQKLKYHIQTSGRSLHAQEIDFNDIRTTLQALYSIYDHCNSLHTNAYDEAITTPTEESVRRAVAIQLIINQELGLAKNENPLQGSFVIEELTHLVEEAVLLEFQRLSDRGGVLGAMETMYQRHKIQEESLYYETLKHNSQLPIVGVNTFLNKKGSPFYIPKQVIRASTQEKDRQIKSLHHFHRRNAQDVAPKLRELQNAIKQNQNVFEQLMEVCKVASLGQITKAIYEIGGQYRRSM